MNSASNASSSSPRGAAPLARRAATKVLPLSRFCMADAPETIQRMLRMLPCVGRGDACQFVTKSDAAALQRLHRRDGVRDPEAARRRQRGGAREECERDGG